MKTVHDLGFAAYLIVVEGYDLKDRPTFTDRYCFVFDITNEELDKLFLKYIKSKYYSFDRMTKQLKKMIHQSRTKPINNNGSQ